MVFLDSLGLSLSDVVVLLFFLCQLDRKDVQVKLVDIIFFFLGGGSLVRGAVRGSFFDQGRFPGVLGGKRLGVRVVVDDLLVSSEGLGGDLVL
jgi:hypothetical protein